MVNQIFYYNTIKNLIVAFASVFDNVKYYDDFDAVIKVPLHYAPKEKFISYFLEDTDFRQSEIEFVLPRMAFEISSLNFASERFVNPLNKIHDHRNDETKYIFSRLPYNVDFTLYIATKKFEDSLKIVEQILPFFTPELNITINDKDDFDLKTDVPIVLNSAGFDIDYEGDYANKRTIMWTLTFTAKAWIYGDTKQSAVIKETINNLTQKDFDKKFEILTSEISPRTARKYDEHIIIDSIENKMGDGPVQLSDPNE